MGWSCLQEQAKTLDKVRKWEREQENYAKGEGEYIFFELITGGKDYGTKENPCLELEIIECQGRKGQRRGCLLITPSGRTINRSYIDLPVFEDIGRPEVEKVKREGRF